MAAAAASKDKVYTLEEVARHDKEGDLWIVVNGAVWDLSRFADMHPGGSGTLLQRDIAGKDATEAFFSLHRSEVLLKYARYQIGRVENPKAQTYILPEAGALSKVPSAEPPWLDTAYSSPYYDESHKSLQKEMRRYFDTMVKGEARERELTDERPSAEVYESMGSAEWEILAMRMGPGKHLHGRKLPGGVKPEQFNYFHELVVIQELVRIGAPGYLAGVNAGMVIGLPPLLNFPISDRLKNEVVPNILRGKTFISLAISEAAAGSDVFGMTTEGVKTPCGKFWEVTGSKKWITNGHFSEYFMTGVRTGPGKLTMMLIERDDNVETKKIKTSYSGSAGTAYVFFDKVRVPVENVINGEGNGLKTILSNFNHERWVINCRIARYSRVIYEETFKWAHLRKVYGKPLIGQPVVRQKLAHMMAKIEAGQAWLEHITYQMTQMPYEQQSKYLAGPMALLKYYLSKAQGEIVDEAVQIWGGRALTRGGMGVYIEQAQRTYKFDSILGGSEEVLADLGVRQASKVMPKAVL